MVPFWLIWEEGPTDVIVFSGGSIRHTGVVPIAGDQVTNDIAMALRTPTFEAEKIKIKHGICKQGLVETNENINVRVLVIDLTEHFRGHP